MNNITRQMVVTALINSRFKWRTARGISKELSLPINTVQLMLDRSPEVLRSKKANKSGRPLYTVRDKYKKTTSLSKRLFAALRNEAT